MSIELELRGVREWLAILEAPPTPRSLDFPGHNQSGAPYTPERATTTGNAPAEVWSTRTSTATQQPLSPGRMAAPERAPASEICAWSTSSSTSAHLVRPRLRGWTPPKWAPPSSSG